MNKSALLIVVSLVVLSASNAQAETLQQAIAACKRIANDSQRLNCFDALVISGEQSVKKQAAVEAPPLVRQRSEKSAAADVAASRTPVSAPTPQNNSNRRAAPPAQSREAVTQNTPAQSDKVSEFGLAPKKPVDQIERIASVIASIEDGPRDTRYVHLQDGSVWKQTDSTRMRLKEGQEVYVERGALGAFYLSRENVNRRIKVKRIQ
ncbi:hypothetical protein [Alteromonas gilva]|uniref:Uncharacterized protein n=1 Tax=Alteromonas gilva TaxID=2987522 RepID=A0ABT5L6Q3_9ALTE|nr:hypothetical protein [Alteromonas gilva]MDC8832166.1 hypothetical protein [Alteromonas gilva]